MSTLIRDCSYQIASKYEPFPPASQREKWELLPTALQKKLLLSGNRFLQYSYPHIQATDFMTFSRTGNRTAFEELYFAKRRALNALVLAECVEHQGTYMDDIINGIYSICEETAWQLPAHNSYIRDTPQLLLPDVTSPVLDLFACETGALLATVYALLNVELEQISPFINTCILKEIRERIIEPYLSRHFWWMGKEAEPMCNWTVWCTQNVLLTAFLTPQDPAVQNAVMKQACYSLDCFLKDYGDDGCCEEGAQYYRHAGLCLLGALDIMNAVTDGAFAHLFEHEKIRNIALYILNVHIAGPYYANFADCSPIAGRAGVREYLFGKRIHDGDLMLFAASDFAASEEAEQLLLNEINLFYRLQNTFFYAELLDYAQNALHPCEKQGLKPPVFRHRSLYYESIGLFLVRSEQWALAAKAGCNDDSHNHNDTGSFIIYKDAKPFVIDIGVESYTKKTFSPERYEIWTMQSTFHNLPTFLISPDNTAAPSASSENAAPESNIEIMQCAGAAYRAKVNQVDICPDGISVICMDIADCYPPEAQLKSYERTITFSKEQGITIQDSYCGELNCYISLMLYERPLITDRHIQVGSLGTMTVSKGCTCVAECIPITDVRLKTAWEHDIYRVKIYPPEREMKLWIS